jgi:hypothetical protein
LRRRLVETLPLLRLRLRLRLLAALLLPRPFMVLTLLLLFALDGLLWDLGTLLRLGLLLWPTLLRRNLRPLLPTLRRLSLRLLLRGLHRPWLLWWLLRRLRPGVPLLWRQTLLISRWLSLLLLLLLLRSLLSGPSLLPVGLLLVLRLGRPLLPIFLFVFLLLAEDRNRSAEGEGQ